MRLCVLLSLLALPAAAAPPLLTPASVDPDVPHALLVVPEAGRYTLRAQSAEGTALRLADRMLGTLAKDGVAGASDGRIDVFLDAGEYRLIVERAPKAVGRIALSAHHVAEVEPQRRLERLSPRETTLVDGQARGWWVRIDEPQVVVIEAAGRALDTLQVWQDGRWLHATQPRCRVAQPEVGRPIRRCTLAPRLPAGLHRVVAYGGAPQPWTESGDPRQDALFAQWGVPKLAVSGVRQVVVNTSGVARFQVPTGVERVRLALASPGTAKLSVTPWTPSKPFERTGRTARIANDARVHVAEVRTTERPAYIEVQAAPGTHATLRWFPAQASDTLVGPGAWRVSSVHADDDGVPPTAVLYQTVDGTDSVVAESVIALSPDAPLRRQFNLPASAEVFLRVTAPMTVQASATEARMRLIPLWTRPPDGYHAPALQSALTQDVAPGLYRLELQPDRPAITTLLMHAADRAAPQVDSITPIAINLGDITLGQGERRRVVRASSPSASATLALPLPADATMGIPLSLAPGAVAKIPVVPGRGRLSAQTSTGQAMQVSATGLVWDNAITLTADDGIVHVRNPTAGWVQTEARRLPASARTGALPPVTAADRALIPELPVLAAGDRVAATLDRNASKSWRLTVPQAGAWVAESTGLLATTGTMRTRTRLNIDTAPVVVPHINTTRRQQPTLKALADGGTGRNFGVRRYLRAGDYLLTVATKGQSKGRLGVRLGATPTRDEGELRPGRVARATVAAGEAVAWRFTLTEQTHFQVSAEGPTGPAQCRLEDADGWFVGQCDRSYRLPAGVFRAILTPTKTAGLRRVRLALLGARKALEGSGPHPIALDAAIDAIWREPAADGARVPQVFAFAMPAAGDVAITAPDSMVIEVVALGTPAGETRVTRVSPGRTFQGALAAGAHELRVLGARRNDGVEYSLTVAPEQLLPGMTQTAETDRTRRATVTLVVPSAGLYTVVTDGNTDARLTLIDPDGVQVAVQDDRPDDWNVRLTRRLTPGRYTAIIELPERYDSTDVRFDAADPEAGEGIALGDRRTLTPTANGVTLPIESTIDRDTLIAVHIEARENVGVAIEAAATDSANPGTWRMLASGEGRGPLAAVRSGNRKLRLRIWSLDALGRPAVITVQAVRAKTVAEAAWQRSADLPEQVAAVQPKVSPGAFVIAPTPGMLMCPRVDAGCVVARPGGVPISADGVFFVGMGGTVSGRRIQVAEGAGPALTVTERAVVDLPRGRGPMMFSVTAPMGQPGAAMGEGASARVKGRALAFDLSGKDKQGTIWSTSGAPINARMQAWRLTTGAQQTAKFGRNAVVVPASSVVAVTLPDGPRSARVLVPHHGVASMPVEGATVLAWGADGPTVDGARGVLDTITLANPTAKAAVFELEVIGDHRKAPPVLSTERPFEERGVRSGSVRMAVAASPGATLHIRGAQGEFLRADGAVFWLENGDTAAVEAGGTLVLRHAVGPMLAWVADARRPGPWPLGADIEGSRLRPGHLELYGPPQRFEMGFPDGRMLHIRLTGNVVLRAESQAMTHVLLEGTHDIWVPDGSVSLTVRGLAGTALAGAIQVGASAPETLTEGIGEPTLLGPGDTRLYRFETTRKAAVGIGVRANADRVRTTVYDMKGTVIAQGGSVMPELDAGTWLLALHLPADAAPVEARPALIGVAPRGDGPPPSTIRTYVENAQ